MAAYVRVSTEGQAEETGLEAQRQAIIAYAAANGIQIQTWYSDVLSGALEERPGLDALRRSAHSGMVSLLLLYRIDRLARDVRIGTAIYRELQDAGVKVTSVCEAMMDGSLTGNLMRSIILAFAEYERSVIALRTTSGRRHRVATTGSWAGGVAPFGYDAAGDRQNPGHGVLRVNEEQARAIRTVFGMRDRGESLSRIAGALNEEGVRTTRGALFTAAQIHRILARRDLYAGINTTTPSIPLSEGVQPRQEPIIDPGGGPGAGPGAGAPPATDGS